MAMCHPQYGLDSLDAEALCDGGPCGMWGDSGMWPSAEATSRGAWLACALGLGFQLMQSVNTKITHHLLRSL